MEEISAMEPNAKRRRDLLTAAALLAFAVFYLVQTFGYSAGNEDPGLPDARTLPFLLTGALVLLSLVLLGQALSSRRGGGGALEVEEDARVIEEPSYRRLALLLGMVLVYLVVMPYVGFVVSTVALGIALQMVIFRVSWMKSILISVFVSGMSYLVFAVLLGVLLP